MAGPNGPAPLHPGDRGESKEDPVVTDVSRRAGIGNAGHEHLVPCVGSVIDDLSNQLRFFTT